MIAPTTPSELRSSVLERQRIVSERADLLLRVAGLATLDKVAALRLRGDHAGDQTEAIGGFAISTYEEYTGSTGGAGDLDLARIVLAVTSATEPA